MSRSKLLLTFAICSVVFAFYIFYYGDLDDNIDIPLIYPEHGPTKILPRDPGGVEIPNMDKSVYGYLSSTHKTVRPDKIMPEPEQPILSLDKPESVFDINSLTDKSEESDIFNIKVKEERVTEQNSHKELNVITVDRYDKRLFDSEKNQQKLNQEYNLQLYLTKSEKQALEEWNKALKNNKDLLINYNYSIRKVDRGEKGIIYNLYIGPFSSYAEANSICKKLKKMKQGCMVVID